MDLKMDFLYLSPEFPPNYANFILKLDEMNVNVWGIGESDFHFMPEKLRSALKWYVRTNLNSVAEVENALENLLSVKTSLGTSPKFDMVESHNEQWLQLEGFINHKLGIDGIQPKDLGRLKKKSVAKIVTYDGLVDGNGRILFENSLIYGEGVLEYVLGKDTFFYVSRHIPDKLSQIGRRLTTLFDIRRKFFHFEFFMVNDDYMPIEINCRPPGGAILDMMNFSVDDDLYAAYARMIAQHEAAVATEKKYYCCYLGRRDKDYMHRHSDILATFGHCLVEYAENPFIFQKAMGKYRYILRSESESEILRMADFVLQTP
jgi:hypothetical protein